MPKAVYNILQFHGGISNDADPRDIAENQFADLQNVAIDEVGKIIVLGDLKTSFLVLGALFSTPGGRGFISIKTDYDNFETGADAVSGAAAANSKKYFLVEKYDSGTPGNSKVQVVRADDYTANDLINTTNINGASMYWAKGALRIYSATHVPSSMMTPQWRGYIKGVMYGTDSGVATNLGHIPNSAGAVASNTPINQWYTVGAQIKGCFEEETYVSTESTQVTSGLNLICGNTHDCTNGLTSGTGGFRDDTTSLFGFANENCGTGVGSAAPGNMTTNTGMYWGFALPFREGGPNDTNDNAGTWAPNGVEGYQFYCSTIYDGIQESALQLFTHYPSGYQAEQQNTDNTHGPSSNAIADNSYQNATVETNIIFSDPIDHNTKGTGVSVHFNPIIKWTGTAYGQTTAEGAEKYAFGAVDANGDGNAGGTANGNPRITGLKVYWSSSEDGFSDKWELFEWNFEKGFKAVGSKGGGSGSYALTDFTTAGIGNSADETPYHRYHHTHAGEGGGYGVEFTDPPKIVRYTDTNGHPPDELLSVQSFKAVTIASGRAWIGNVQIDGVVHSDAMISSKVGQYDKFPTDTNRENVVSNDGDSIVALAEYADRILQFKEDVLYILNVTGEYIGLEAKHTYKGVTNPGAVCRTDYGVAWANTFGCYVYDGEKVIDLLEAGGQRKINKSTWNTHIGTADYHRVGFNPLKRQIIVTAGAADSGAAYIYDMATQSWTYSSSLIEDPNTGSNFINDLDTGVLLIHDVGGNTIDKWTDIPTATPTISIKTKDIDFGQPSLRKKIYKVYVSYKGDGSAVTVGYRTNGEDTATPGNFYKITSATDGSTSGATDSTTPLWSGTAGTTDWLKAELKPVVSINNKNSFQLIFGGTAATNFEINDISIVYRVKNIK